MQRARGQCGYGVNGSRDQWILYETVEVTMWVWCGTVDGANGYAVEGSMGVWCEEVEGSMDIT